MRRFFVPILLVASLVSAAAAKNDPIVVEWPANKPVIRLTFEKFRQEGSYSGQSTYVTDVIVVNLTDKQIPRAAFNVYLNDKNNVRVGQGYLTVADLEPKQTARMQFQFNSVGNPVGVTLAPKGDFGAKTIPLKVVSIPPGGMLKVDGIDAGTTPVMVRFTVGVHQLLVTKEGYALGNTPIEVTADELPGGSITIELGGMSRDTVELRDGTVILGDVLSMSMTEVVVRSDGKDQPYPRNQVKKIMLVERIIEQPVVALPPGQATHK